MEAREPLGHMEKHEHLAEFRRHFGTPGLILVAILAALLAIATLLANEEVKNAILYKDKASNEKAHFHANEVKSFIHENDARVLRLLGEQSTETASQRAAEEHAARLDERAMRQLAPIEARSAVKARQYDKASEHAEDRHFKFEVASAGFQIAIVVASVAIIVGVGWVLIGATGIGVLGLIMLLAGLLA